MLTRILLIIGGLVWCTLVFVLTVWLTFPSQAIVDRLAYAIQEGTGGDYALKATGASPYWLGLTLYDVELIAPGPRNLPGTQLLQARSLSARTSLASAFSSRHPIYGVIDMGGSRLPFQAGVDRSDGGARVDLIKVSDAQITLDTIGALLSSYGAGLTGSGELTLDIDLSMGTDIKDHEGRVALRGRGLGATLSVPDPFGGDAPFELGPISVSSVEIAIEARSGKVSLRTADLRSDLANLTVDGDLTLDGFFGRSRLRGKAILSDLGGMLSTFESFLSNARWDDGSYHYTIACTVDRLNTTCFRPDRQRPTRPAATRGGIVRPSPVAPGGAPDASDRAAELRAEREKQRQERLAERRARLEAARPTRSAPQRPIYEDDDLELDLDDDELDDEMPRGPAGLDPGGTIPMRAPELLGPTDLALPPGGLGPNDDWD